MQRVQAEVADTALQQIIQTRPGDAQSLYLGRLGAVRIFQAVADRHHQTGANLHVFRLCGRVGQGTPNIVLGLHFHII